MRMRLRSRPPAGARGKRKSGPRARSTNSQPSGQLPASDFWTGSVPPKNHDVSGRPHHRILHPAPAPRGPKPHTPARPCRRRNPPGADPQPRTGFSCRHGVPEGTSDFWLSGWMVGWFLPKAHGVGYLVTHVVVRGVLGGAMGAVLVVV